MAWVWGEVRVARKMSCSMAMPADQQASILRVADPQAVQPLALVHRDPAPATPATHVFLRLIHSTWPAGTAASGGPPAIA